MVEALPRKCKGLSSNFRGEKKIALAAALDTEYYVGALVRSENDYQGICLTTKKTQANVPLP
jgi:hypothetical protein